MKKQNYYKILYIAAILLFIGFAVRLGVDYSNYRMTSAPFYLYIIIRSFEFLVPALIVFMIGVAVKRRYR